jgi:hypothetical protein
MDDASPPPKRRRFFTPDPSEILSVHSPNLPGRIATENVDQDYSGKLATSHKEAEPAPPSAGFDKELFETLTGETLDAARLEKIIAFSDGNLERGETRSHFKEILIRF